MGQGGPDIDDETLKYGLMRQPKASTFPSSPLTSLFLLLILLLLLLLQPSVCFLTIFNSLATGDLNILRSLM